MNLRAAPRLEVCAKSSREARYTCRKYVSLLSHGKRAESVFQIEPACIRDFFGLQPEGSVAGQADKKHRCILSIMVKVARCLVRGLIDKAVTDWQGFQVLFQRHSQLFRDFAAHRLMGRLTMFDPAPCERPFTFSVSMWANKQEFTAIAYDDCADFLAELQAALVKIGYHGSRLSADR